jgi:nitronate monooxygenase
VASRELARGIQNQLLDKLNAPDVEMLPYPLQRFLVRNMSCPAEKSGRQELIRLRAGQSANLAHHTRTTELLDTLVSGASAIAGPVLKGSSTRVEQQAILLTVSVETESNTFALRMAPSCRT